MIDFSTRNWVDIPADTRRIQVQLLAKPPVGANLKIVIFSREISESSEWEKIGASFLDNLAHTPDVQSTSFPVKPRRYYSFKVQGEAHLLMPQVDKLRVGLSVLADDDELFDYGSPQAIDGNAAGLIGVTYLQLVN
ncbi:hypothetical protein [Janthinobacterium sp. 1_2014MBL_MicDiv]|uniref:hypothetical protein n=1 Tax=Janthinobacterium sp. 1_2014MBL_MicDiv TaxID=1644131 RepID=UPI0008F472C1|nr:hypothetical protein [Janthinobacterium sp. 1_2014MBL_MicDiv]APA68080.1 hypothetical protein YQ44_09805 [Janthinobacterium sp. 1_2014MBL_MicDiv]